MVCPRCSVSMETQDYEGVAVDRCPSCQGRWLDRGELVAVCERREREFTEEERDAFFDELHAKQDRRKDVSALAPELTCPACRVAMTRLEYAYSSTVVIDRCPTCDGIYLDSGELEHLQMWHEERDAYREHVPATSHSTVAAAGGGLLSALFEAFLGLDRRGYRR